MLFFYNYLYNPVKNRRMQTSNSNYKKKKKETFLSLHNTQRERNVSSHLLGVLKKTAHHKIQGSPSSSLYHPSHARIPVVNTC